MKTLLLILMCIWMLHAERVRDLVQIEGVRENQVVGYGIVVGLNGTGDKRQTLFSTQSLAAALQRFQVNVPPQQIQVKNTAAVLVTATLPPFVSSGLKLDVNVAAIGDAASLSGGMLILTPLKGADGQVYCAAQGSLVVAGFTAARGNNVQVRNHPTAGRLPGGCLVERAAPSVMPEKEVRLQMKSADFETAVMVATRINEALGNIAKVESAGTVHVKVPEAFSGRVPELIARIEGLPATARRRTRIVVNERTGTIAIGAEVRVKPTSVLHGGLTIQIQSQVQVSQPNAFGQGSTSVVEQVQVQAREDAPRALTLQEGTTVEELVRGLQRIGATARDIIAILESLKAADAFDADLEVI